MIEEWRPVVGLEDSYEVSDQGRVRSLDRLDTVGRRVHGHVLTNARLATRYVRIRLRSSAGHHEETVHQMVLRAFVGPRPDGAHACHNNGDTSDNRLVNLRWDTASANQMDKVRHGTMARGSRNGFAKLTEAQVRDIRSELAAGTGPTALSRRFGASRVHVQHIRRGLAWGWLTEGAAK